MVKYNVFFEPVLEFNKRMSGFEKYISFSEVLADWKKDSTIEELSALLNEYDICIFRVDTYSLATSLVFENIELLNKLFKLAEISEVYIHNPPKKFLNSLKQQIPQEQLFISNKSFEKISEQEIIQVKIDLNARIIGQDKAKKSILRKLVAQLVRPGCKPLVLMFYGDPGIGKTETAKQLSATLFQNEEIVREQMSMVGGESSVKYFKSTTHSEDSFSKTLLNRASNVILLDEFALAPSFFHTTFFQMFDEGIYEDQNYRVDLRNSIIICTSNYKSRSELQNNIDDALLSRFDGFIKFSPLSFKEKKNILELVYNQITSPSNMMSNYTNHLNEMEILTEVTNKLESLRNVREIRKYVEDIIADKLLEFIINSGE